LVARDDALPALNAPMPLTGGGGEGERGQGAGGAVVLFAARSVTGPSEPAAAAAWGHAMP
jgi:hypothetical protein